MNSKPKLLGVIGAGTMGAGIAQLAAQAGIATLLHDPLPDARERGIEYIKTSLERFRKRGKISDDEMNQIIARVQIAPELSDLGACEFVIEAAPERLELKLELFRALEQVISPECVVATNTSSLSVTELAAAFNVSERFVGLHFFNPAPIMRLVEVVAGQTSSPEALATARAVGEAMGKQVIQAADIPGFIVNACNRPYSLEALGLLQSRAATVPQIDRIMRLGSGFRMGPFELMDLVGLDINHAVAEAFYRQTYGEPRYRPSPIQGRMVAAGRLGRKTGAGWYEYGQDPLPEEPEPPAPVADDGHTLVVLGELPVVVALRDRLTRNGFTVLNERSAEAPWLTISCGTAAPLGPGPHAVLVAGASLHQIDVTAAGFHLLPPLDDVRLLEVTSTTQTDPIALERLCKLADALGWRVEHVADAPGLVAGRIICQLINEAAFLVGEGNGSPADVDLGMELGVNHPRGPIGWAHEIGLAHVVAVLEALQRELGQERYRIAQLLRDGLAVGAPGIVD